MPVRQQCHEFIKGKILTLRPAGWYSRDRRYGGVGVRRRRVSGPGRGDVTGENKTNIAPTICRTTAALPIDRIAGRFRRSAQIGSLPLEFSHS